ncbi:MAG: ATP synthase F1 subunit gamma [Spirochaetia bacterium]|nr:ATP synthase F1 subunit gamma [Spirochaetia bacterium]
MATLRTVRKRIKSARNIQQITKAMKMVSAAKLRKAQERIMNARPYAEKIEEVIDELIDSVGPDKRAYPMLRQNEGVKKEALVVIAGDKGLCGSYNVNIIDRAMKELKENHDKNLFVIGKKGLEAMKKVGIEIEKFKYNDKNIDWNDIDELGSDIIKKYSGGKYSKVTMIFSEFQSSLQQKVVTKQLLPVVFEKDEVKKVRDFIYEPTETDVLNGLLIRYAKVQLFRAVLESQTAEQGVRMVSMEMATNNASDMIRNLTLLANKTRQSQITTEILEIVSGAEALK